MARNGFMVCETTFVPRSVCFSLKAEKDIENGSIVGKGDLVEGEMSVYEAEDDYSDGIYLVANPAWSYDTSRMVNQNEENFINKAGSIFRVYRLGKDMKYKVYNLDLETPFVACHHVMFQGGKYAKDDTSASPLVVERVEEVGFPFCVGSGGTLNGDYGYAVGEVMKKYIIRVTE